MAGVRALVVYESMTGNLHEVAMRVGVGLTEHYDVTVLPVGEATAYHVAGADLLVVGAPSDQSWAPLDDWLDDMLVVDGLPAAAFDTCIEGREGDAVPASMVIAERLGERGYTMAASPQRFVVDDRSELIPGEAENATAWAARLASQLV
jgi:hypothetical protein